MKKFSLLLAIVAILVFTPMILYADYDQGSTAKPPISQPLVREGSLAVDLVAALKLGSTTSEVDAESILVSAGIAPHNGWVADYPVTPDIAGEIREAVINSANAGSISLGQNDALAALNTVLQTENLALNPTGSDNPGNAGESGEYYDNSAVNDYYYDEGPPVVTYYSPPPAYAYLYSWVPYPFWWTDFWFPGFYVLADFDTFVVSHGRPCVVSNHFWDRDHHGFVRVDPGQRFHHNAATLTSSRVVGPRSFRTGTGSLTPVTRSRSSAISDRLGGRSGSYNAPRSTSAPSGRGTYTPSGRTTTIAPSGRSTTTTPRTGSFTTPSRQRSNLDTNNYIGTSGYRSPVVSPRSVGEPRTTFTHPSRSYSAPSRNYTAPARSYSAPSRNFNTPSVGNSFSVPATRSFSSPSIAGSPGGGFGRSMGGFRR